jgi:hypothetical protein
MFDDRMKRCGQCASYCHIMSVSYRSAVDVLFNGGKPAPKARWPDHNARSESGSSGNNRLQPDHFLESLNCAVGLMCFYDDPSPVPKAQARDGADTRLVEQGLRWQASQLTNAKVFERVRNALRILGPIDCELHMSDLPIA